MPVLPNSVDIEFQLKDQTSRSRAAKAQIQKAKALPLENRQIQDIVSAGPITKAAWGWVSDVPRQNDATTSVVKLSSIARRSPFRMQLESTVVDILHCGNFIHSP